MSRKRDPRAIENQQEWLRQRDREREEAAQRAARQRQVPPGFRHVPREDIAAEG